ncbi:hypothetical protein JOL79_04555 [Microbispora sp. RL4-1S]|uniref:DUF1440 domain-containing protein n=1 Tax=Microbispora oryzae TaxID=2806554 RepID=A0A940WH29_9ACTN|nr:DUF6789 family protein [Microbispora oryzae]MBP2703072.1 hypothetical protein [Microbispora oryzae]
MMRNLVNGAVGGALATAAYSAVLMAADRAGLLDDRPAGRRSQMGLRLRRARSRRDDGALAAIGHYAFGAACGSALGLLSAGQRIPLPIGPAYGAAVWYLGFRGSAPAVGAVRPDCADRAGRQALLLVGHLMWGTALTVTLNRLRPEKIPAIRAEVRTPRTPAPQPIAG